MNHTRLTAALALGLSLTLVPAVKAGDAADDAKAIATKATAAGAAMFDARDAKGLALTYVDDARLEVYTRESSGALKTEIKVGRAEIEGYYAELFKSTESVHSRNTIEYARRVGHDLILFSGSFTPNTEATDPVKVPFTQVRMKQGDAWKVVNLQVFILLP